jgi:UDP-glucose 4-epimerase
MRNVLTAAEKLGAGKLVVASSDCVYGFFKDGRDGLSEDSPLKATRGFRYAENKVEVEKMVADFTARVSGCRTVVLRPCIVTGPNMNNAFGKSLKQPVVVRIMGYDPIMQFIHEEDVAEAFYLALMKDVQGAYNLAVDTGVRLSEMAAIAGRPVLPIPSWLMYPLIEGFFRIGIMEFGSSQLDYIRYPMSMNADKIRQEMGFSPKYTSKQALETYVATF